MTSNNPNKAKP